MPYVELKLVGKLTKEQKAKIVEGFSDTLEKVAKKPKEYTYVSIEEFEASILLRKTNGRLRCCFAEISSSE